MTDTTPREAMHAKAGGALLAKGVGDGALRLREVSFGYEPGVPVVRSVTAELRPGRVCALIGPNAAGKSTLLKLMLGQLEPDGGKVRLGRDEVAELAVAQRAVAMSYVPQRGGVSFAFTVEQVVSMGRFAAGDEADAVDRALGVCDLADVRGRVFAELSGGQQQRVLLARAVAQASGGGRVMLLDEPASGMDLWHVHQTMRLLKGLADGEGDEAGPAVLVVLHDVNLAARYADDVWLMDEGRLVATGRWDEVLRPELLEGVYGVRFTPMAAPQAASVPVDDHRRIPGDATDSAARPVFWVDPAGKIE